MSEIFIQPIAIARTPFKQKFAIPRQPNLAQAPGTLIMNTGYDSIDCFDGIEGFSHLWLIFHFNETASAGWKSKVKAPRLGGNASLGVFASRSTFRPNGLGLSVVQNKGIRKANGRVMVDIEGADLLDNTPIIDIKPYLPYADAIPSSSAQMNRCPLDTPTLVPVEFKPNLWGEIKHLEQKYAGFTDLVTKVLAQDPRPAYKRSLTNDPKLYKVQLYDVDIAWQWLNNKIIVEQFTLLPSS
jgi:tRNA-Thr(GGU) m(6)t(6)A37 methyltransferase TsaA